VVSRIAVEGQGAILLIVWNNIRIKLGDLVPWSRNPKSISKQHATRLLELWDKLGQFQTIAVSPQNDVYDGHQRLNVLMAAHGKDYEVDARQSSRLLTEKEREELVVAAHVGTVGQFDWEQLSGWDAPELIAWGMDDTALKDWKHDVSALSSLLDSEKQEVDAPPQMDRAAELNEKWGVKTGDLWQIGEHRLLCGDSTVKADVDKVMGGEKAVCMWTDPPYGVEYVGKTKDALTIENDGADDLPGLLTAVFMTADTILEDGAPIYVAHPPGALQMIFDKCFVDVGWKFHETLVWVKDTMVMGHSDYHYKHEPIIYGWKGKNRFWYSGRDQVSVFEIDRPKRSTEHPTMKPPELVEACLSNSTMQYDITFEPFLGSGTTMVACENLHRKCRGIEISPNYCAVIIERMTTAFPELEIVRISES
jgi:DNA modification methylase